MAIFSRKSKSKKADKDEKNVKPADLPDSVPPPPAPYRHTPQHAAADAIGHGDKGARSRASSRGVSPSPFSQRKSFGSTSARPERQDRFTSGMPGLASRSQSSVSNVRSNGYHAPSFDSPILGNPKMRAAARDRGYINPHYSADSGYGSNGPSAAQSRKTSANHSPQESLHAPTLKQSAGFLPELSLGEDLAREPAFSERSFTEDKPADIPVEAPCDDSYLDSQRPTDTQSIKSNKSQRSLRKQARFEEPNEPVPAMPQPQYQSQPRESLIDPQMQRSSSYVHATRTTSLPVQTADHSHEDHSAAVHVVSPIQERSSETLRFEPPARAASPAYTSSQAGPYPHVGYHSQPTTNQASYFTFQEPAPQTSIENESSYVQPESYESPARGRHSQSYYSDSLRTASPIQTRRSSNVDRLNHLRQRSNSVPPLTILDGLKVNKRGRILDEEGDQIGELYEGDIIDCVRQKANAYGEVLDEYGGVVGRVRTVQRTPQSPSYSRSESRVSTHGNYFSQNFQLPSHTPTAQPDARSESEYSQSQQQRPYQYQQIPRLTSPPPQEPLPAVPHMSYSEQRPSIAPLDLPRDEPMVELDGSERSIPEPVIDYSDSFMPPPHLPARSLRRSESPPERLQPPSVSENAPSEDGSVTSERSGLELPATVVKKRSFSRPVTAVQSAQTEPEHAQTTPEVSQDSDQSVKVESAEPVTSTDAVNETEPKLQQSRSAVSRMLSRTVSEKFTRPAIPPVPENETLPLENSTSNMFKYKGEIPATNGPPPGTRLSPANRIKSPPLPAFPRQAFTNAPPGGHPLANANLGMGVGRSPMSGPPSRRVTTSNLQVAGMKRPGLNTRFSTNTPLVRSPLSSHETTPPESDEGSTESDTVGDMQYSKFRAHSRAPSVRTMSSISSTGKPRTYFTHAGRITVEDGDLPPSAQPNRGDVKTPTAVVKETKPKEEAKKKSRMSLFGKKK